MRFTWKVAALCVVAGVCLAAAGLAVAQTRRGGDATPTTAGNSSPSAPSPEALSALAKPNKNQCQLGHGTSDPVNGKIKHVIEIQFDNTHFNRDNPNVASDLEQMPHLLNFLKDNGTLFTNDHTILISHTAGGILSTLTGLYPDRQGMTVSNSYDYFDSSKNPHSVSGFKYWTDVVDATNDKLPNMITDGQKTTPAPWVPFTRAGCDVGGVGTANIELENTNTSASGDMTRVFGANSPEWNEANADSQAALTDFVGIAIHCAQTSQSLCNNNSNAKDDPLADEPGGYTGYKALYGAKYVDPAITGGKACVPDTNGDPITDPVGRCGFPGFDGMLASNSLGYVAAMQEAGVPVTYAYISDAHDLHVPTLSTDSYSSSATGPGEITHLQQLKAYDTAFDNFFQNLQQHGIDRSNTLFVITVDEGDHFAGGIGTPQPDADNLIYDHRTCSDLTKCPTNQIGEIDTNIKSLTTAQNYDIHFDDAPAFYVNGMPGPTDPNVRSLEQQVGGLTSLDPYVRQNGVPQTVKLTDSLADPVELKALHMINTDPARTPTFVMFGNPDFFFQTSPGCTVNGQPVQECVGPAFAWNHGDIQQEIGNTWVGFVGPGIDSNGIDSQTWTDHTNVRPTILYLTGLKDDYTEDGHVLVQALEKNALNAGLNGSAVAQLEQVDEQLNAPFGQFSSSTLASSTKALESNDANDATYTSIEKQISDLTDQRDPLANQIRQALNDAAFNGGNITNQQAQQWISQANAIIAAAGALPH
jgi:hypothetical protein